MGGTTGSELVFYSFVHMDMSLVASKLAGGDELPKKSSLNVGIITMSIETIAETLVPVDRRTPDADGREYVESDVTIRPAKVLKFLVATSCVVVAMGTLANVFIYQIASSPDEPLARVAKRFDLVNEPSLHQWYGCLIFSISSALLAVIAIKQWTIRDVNRFHWAALAMIFLGLSIDDAVMIHEMAVNPVKNYLGTSGVLSIAWIIPGALFVVIVAAAYAGFLARLDRRTRWLMIFSGAIFVSGAIVMEMPGGVFYEQYRFSTWHYITSYAIEELLELTGISLFVFTLLDFIRRTFGGITFGFVHVEGGELRTVPSGEPIRV